jgi:hypothetical protein
MLGTTMTSATYPGTYTDMHGQEALEFLNDGSILITTIRGVHFNVQDFDSLKPATGTTSNLLATCTLNQGDLCKCVLAFEIPIPILAQGSRTMAKLRATLELGASRADGGIDLERLLLSLFYMNTSVTSSGASSFFECELLEIQAQLPGEVSLCACINCLYSDYSPYGQGLFGSMLCFRNIKDEYLHVTSKFEFWAVHGREDRQVQKTFLCEQFQVRVAGTGYRG